MRQSEDMDNIDVRQDENGVGEVLILKGQWTEDVAAYMQSHGIFALRLSDSFGSQCHDLSFLAQLSFLRSLELYCWDAKGVNVIESLPQLEVLGLQYKTTQKVDLSQFSSLRVALVTWSKGLSSLLGLSSLEKLNIQNYPHCTLEPISHMKALRQLYLTSRKLESLKGIEHLERLEVLDLYNCPHLESLAGVEACPNLSQVEVEACKRVSA